MPALSWPHWGMVVGGGSTGPAHLTVRHEVNEVRRSNVLVGGAHAKLEQRHGQLGRGADLERAWS